MSRSQQKTYTYVNQTGLASFTLDVKLNAEFKIFITTEQIPEEIREKCEFLPKRMAVDSMDEIDSKIGECINQFEQSFVTENKTKVIVYTMNYSESTSYNTDRYGGYSRNGLNGPLLHFAYQVLWRVEFRKPSKEPEVKYYYESVHKSRGDLSTRNMEEIDIPTNAKEMAHTPEREEWFDSMEKQIKRLANQLKVGFSPVGDLLAKRIDSSANFLLEGRKD